VSAAGALGSLGTVREGRSTACAVPSRRERAGRVLTSRTLRRVGGQSLIYAGLAPFVVIATFPIYWMAITAFKQDADLYRMDVAPFWFHLAPTLEHFTRLFTRTYFSAQLLNTVQLAICVVALTMVMAVPAGYEIRQEDSFRWRAWWARSACSTRGERSWSSIQDSRSRSAPGR